MSTRRLDELRLSVQDDEDLETTRPLGGTYQPTVPLDGPGLPGEDETGSRASRKNLIIAGAVIAALLAAMLLFRLLIPVGPSPAEVFEDLDIVGQEWTEARQEIRSAGVGDNEYQLVAPESAAADAGAELLVERVEIDSGSDEVTVHLELDAAGLIAQLDLEGMSWPAAQNALEQAGLEQGSDYEVLTDRGGVWVERNWNVAEVHTERPVAAVILTNPMQNQIEDAGQGVADWTEDQWQDLEDTFSGWGEELEGLLP